MNNFNSQPASEMLLDHERYEQVISLDILPSPESDSEQHPTITLRTTYQDKDGGDVNWECRVFESLFEHTGKTAEKPAPLPEIDEKSLHGEEGAQWEAIKVAHIDRIVNARLYATLYASGLLGQELEYIDNESVRGQIVDQFVEAAQVAHEAQKTTEQ